MTRSVEIPDAVVSRAADAFRDNLEYDAFGEVGDDQRFDAMRFALVAARPYLMPLLDRMAVRDVFVRFWNAVLCNSDVPGWTVQQEAEKARDAVMELARPMPTREQIHALIDYEEAEPFRDNLTDNILALLNGES